MLQDRLGESGREHWLEFAALVGTASGTACVVAAGAIVRFERSAGSRMVLSVFVTASLVSTLVAYSGIRLGTLLDVGPAMPAQMLAAILLAGVQVSSTLLVADIARDTSLRETSDMVFDLRYWLLLNAALAGVAATANHLSARARATWGHLITDADPSSAFRTGYEAAQRTELVNARTAVGIIGGWWLISMFWPNVLFITCGALVATLGMALSMYEQRKASVALWNAAFPRPSM